MTDLQGEIAAFYAQYLAAWNGRDFEALGDCFALPATFVAAAGTVTAADRAALLERLAGNFARLEADGFSHSTLGSLVARRIGEGLAIADARDVRRLRGDGSLQERIDAHYVLRSEPGGWRIAVTVSCAPGWQET